MPAYPVPDDFARRMAEVYGEAGAAWLVRLPAIVADCEARWSVTAGPPFALSYNYVAPAERADGMEVVLKAGYPSAELLTEIETLRLCDGEGMVQLLDADREQGVFLVERLRPGTPLSSLQDDEAATLTAAGVMRRLWRPVSPDHLFPTTADWGRGFQRLRARYHGGSGPLPAALVERAEALFAEMLRSSADATLLHGDLHHDNILAAGSGLWQAIDPKGLVGEPAYEVGALLRNPHDLLDMLDPRRITARRITLLADALGFDRQRLRGWGMAQAVLSAWWSVEDHGHGWEFAIAVAELLDTLRV